MAAKEFFFFSILLLLHHQQSLIRYYFDLMLSFYVLNFAQLQFLLLEVKKIRVSFFFLLAMLLIILFNQFIFFVTVICDGSHS
jgi:hypothetical protein